VNRNPTGASGKEPLGEGERAQLTAIAGTKGFDVELSFPELSEFAFARALLGKPVNRSTRELVRLGLERLAQKATTAFNRASVPGDETRVKAPVCPRCLDIVPGTPGGEPETPHPGPFTDELCAACVKVVAEDRARKNWERIR